MLKEDEPSFMEEVDYSAESDAETDPQENPGDEEHLSDSEAARQHPFT